MTPSYHRPPPDPFHPPRAAIGGTTVITLPRVVPGSDPRARSQARAAECTDRGNSRWAMQTSLTRDAEVSMRSHLLTLVTVVSLLGVAAASDDASENREKIQGTSQAVSTEDSRRTSPDEAVKNLKRGITEEEAMDTNTAAAIQAWAAIIQTALTLLTFIIGIVISIVLYQGTNRLTKLQLLRANYDAWKDIDTFLLEQPDLLKIAGKLNPKATGDATVETQRKRHLIFLLLNPFYSYFYALQNAYVEDRMREKFDTCLRPLLEDEDVFAITQSEVFVEGFAEYCQKLRQR